MSGRPYAIWPEKWDAEGHTGIQGRRNHSGSVGRDGLETGPLLPPGLRSSAAAAKWRQSGKGRAESGNSCHALRASPARPSPERRAAHDATRRLRCGRHYRRNRRGERARHPVGRRRASHGRCAEPEQAGARPRRTVVPRPRRRDGRRHGGFHNGGHRRCPTGRRARYSAGRRRARHPKAPLTVRVAGRGSREPSRRRPRDGAPPFALDGAGRGPAGADRCPPRPRRHQHRQDAGSQAPSPPWRSTPRHRRTVAYPWPP
jgi:hypothetical protein